jgi:hypothetical protein
MKDGAVAMATARLPYWSKADCITDAIFLELLLPTLPKFETLAPRDENQAFDVYEARADAHLLFQAGNFINCISVYQVIDNL